MIHNHSDEKKENYSHLENNSCQISIHSQLLNSTTLNFNFSLFELNFLEESINFYYQKHFFKPIFGYFARSPPHQI